MKKLYSSFCLTAALFFSPAMRAQMNGVYTLDNTIPSSATNFTSFTQLSATLSAIGVNGAVTVNVGAGSGPYTEQVVIPQISGASATNSIVINGNGRTLTYGGGVTAQKSTLLLTGTDFLTVNNLTVSATNGTNAFAVHLWSDANNNTFNGCAFNVPQSGTGTGLCPFSISGSSVTVASQGAAGNNNTVNSCTATGGYYGVAFYGSSTITHLNNRLMNSLVREFYSTGILNTYCDNSLIQGNVIERPTRTQLTTSEGIQISTGSENCIVERNHVRKLFHGVTSTSTGYAIYVSADATANTTNIFRNNVVSDFHSNGTQAGIYATSAEYAEIYHNTIVLDDPASTSGTTYGIYITGPNNTIMNNLIYITRAGTGTKNIFDVSAAGEPGLVSDYNALYLNSSAGTNNVGDLGGTYATLPLWQQGTGHDLNSVFTDPVFSNPSAMDYAPTSTVVNNKGLAIGILTDFLLTPRSPLAPDPGAYEIFNSVCTGTPPPNSFIAPSSSVCPGNSYTFMLQNTSTYTNSGYSVQWMASSVSVGGYTAVPGATLNTFITPPALVDVFYQAVITCTNTNQTISTPIGSVIVALPVIDTVPYFEGFETIAPNGLPNCSWSATNLMDLTFTSSTPLSSNRLPRTGSGFAYFENGGTNYFYSNAIILKTGVTYSAALWYLVDNVNLNNWSELSILVGPNQSPSGLVNVASVSPVTGSLYNLLSNTFSVAADGQYYVAIKATGASGAAQYLSWDDLSVTIPCSLNSPLISLLSPVTTICRGQILTLTASGADTYSWSTGGLGPQITVAPQISTNYFVTGTNDLSGCSSTRSVAITVKESPQLAAFASDPEICSGNSTTLTAAGALNYYWTNGFTGQSTIVSPTATTVYSVSGSNSVGCSSYTTVTVIVNPTPVVGILATSTLVCAGDEVVLQGTGAASYQWMAPQLFVSAPAVSVTIQSSTIFTVVGTSNNCSRSAMITVATQECTGLAENQGHLSFNLYPNPTSGNLHVDGALTDSQLHITDISGRVVYRSSTFSGNLTIDISQFTKGIYYVILSQGSSSVASKIVLE